MVSLLGNVFLRFLRKPPYTLANSFPWRIYTYFANEVYITLPTKYYFSGRVSATSFLEAINETHSFHTSSYA